MKFKEIEHESLNCGWCTTAGVIVGIGVIGGIALT